MKNLELRTLPTLAIGSLIVAGGSSPMLWQSTTARSGFAVVQKADLVIQDAMVWIGDGRVLERATIVVNDGLIVAVQEERGSWTGTVDVDADGRTVLPGLIDTHVHLLALRAGSAEAIASYLEKGFPSVLAEYLASGITTIRSTGDPFEILDVREELLTGMLRGPRLIASGPVLCAVNGHPAVTVCNGFFADDPSWCRQNLARELRDEEAAARAVNELADMCQATSSLTTYRDTQCYAVPGVDHVIRGGGGGASSPPFWGSRAKPAPSRLRRSAAFRGRSPREEGVQGEETERLWITSPPGRGDLLRDAGLAEQEAPSRRVARRPRAACSGRPA